MGADCACIATIQHGAVWALGFHSLCGNAHHVVAAGAGQGRCAGHPTGNVGMLFCACRQDGVMERYASAFAPLEEHGYLSLNQKA
jgi:hypothetical protein